MLAVVGADVRAHLRIAAGHLRKVLSTNVVGFDERARVEERAGRDGRIAEVVPRALGQSAAEEEGPAGETGTTWSTGGVNECVNRIQKGTKERAPVIPIITAEAPGVAQPEC